VRALVAICCAFVFAGSTSAGAAAACMATKLRANGFAVARPASAGIAGGWSWQTSDGRALLYAGGVGPGEVNMKVPWWVKRRWGSSLTVSGRRIGAPGSFRQTFPAALGFSSHPPGYLAVFPSIVDVPTAGCWRLRVSTGKLAGVLVVKVIARPRA
jgi:hypothetical protein